jgi:hypothetical protein
MTDPIDLARVDERLAARGAEQTHYPGCEWLGAHVWCLVRVLKDELAETRAERDRLREAAEMSDGCLSMVRDALKSLGCRCPDAAHDQTPPMCYDDWIGCVVAKREAQIRDRLRAENAALRAVLDADAGCKHPACNIGGGLCADCLTRRAALRAAALEASP